MGTARCAQFLIAMLLFVGTTGCQSLNSSRSVDASHACPLAEKRAEPAAADLNHFSPLAVDSGSMGATVDVAADDDGVRPVGFQIEQSSQLPALPDPSAEPDSPASQAEPELRQVAAPLSLIEVVGSIQRSYPLLLAAIEEQTIAIGNQMSAEGEFDLKLKAESLNGPTGFHQTYRHAAGIEQPVYGGGSVFGGYRIGRGDFQPWYRERQTNDGGEFKAGVTMPLARNRDIDARRAALWLAGFGVEQADPFIQMQLIDFTRAGSLAYWDWVAAGRQVTITRNLLNIAEVRKSGLQRRIDEGDLPAIELTDNERLIVSRTAKVIDAERKLRQSAVKLSLFLRTAAGEPVIPRDEQLPPEFPELDEYDDVVMAGDIARALQQRPELKLLNLEQRRIDVQMSEASNDLQPTVDLTVAGSQDVGAPTSKKRDKSEFELEAGVIVQVPLQRRKARGKLASLEGKLSQVRSKSQFTGEKITAEVQSAAAALIAASGQSEAAARSLELTRQMEQAERTRFESGDSNLLLVNLREQATADAAALLVEAQRAFFQSQVTLQAATADNVQPASGAD